MSTSPSDSPSPNAIATYDVHVQTSDLASNIASNAESDPFPRVLATSRLIAFMEIAAARLLQPCLKPNQLSVGTRVNISHSAPTPVGSKVIAEAKFIGKEKKIFLFEVTARDESGEIGRGTHERAIVDVARLEEAAKKRSGLD
ncbi:HotDog domain-containing protein [Penicillium frequentans]|uniref:HotDog domain-containing protein n=1 Tax=Penicillium frequentans TaxID=3151616 RepID=A0AAD6D7C5_9EURO|nr:HotDog domain-containing protein [Penicillium glabrum]